MKRWIRLLVLFTLALALLAPSAMALAPRLEVSGDGEIIGEGDTEGQLYLAGYDPVSGQFLGLLKNGETAGKNTAVKAMQMNDSYAPQTDCVSALVITQENTLVSGGVYDRVVVTDAVSGAVALERVTVKEEVILYGGSGLTLTDCAVPQVEVNVESAEITTAGTTGAVAVTTKLDTRPEVTVNGERAYDGSGIRFALVQGKPNLAWDPVDEATTYRIYLSKDGGETWKFQMNTGGTTLWLQEETPGVYDTVKIVARKDKAVLGTMISRELRVEVTEEAPEVPAGITFNDNNIAITGLKKGEYFTVHFSETQEGETVLTSSGFVVYEDGSILWNVNNSNYPTYVESGYYQAKSFDRHTLSADGRELSYRVLVHYDWTKCTPEQPKMKLNAFAANIQLILPELTDDPALYLSINGGEAQRVYSTTLSITREVVRTAKDSLSFILRRDGPEGEIISEAKDLIVFQPTGQTTNVTIVGQQNGSYRFTSAESGIKSFGYTLRSPEGEEILTFLTTGAADIAPHEGCTFDVTGYSWSGGTDLEGLTILRAAAQTGVGFTPYEYPDEVQEVTDESSFAAAINTGGRVRLVNDVKLTNCRICKGSAVELDLNGFTLDIGDQNEVQITNGKQLTIVNTAEQPAKISGGAGLDVFYGSFLKCVGISADRILASGEDGYAKAELSLDHVILGQLQISQNARVTIKGGDYGMGWESGTRYGENVSLSFGSELVCEEANFQKMILAYSDSTVTLRGCTLTEGTVISAYGTATVLTDFDPTPYLNPGRNIAVANEDGTWTVKNKNA